MSIAVAALDDTAVITLTGVVATDYLVRRSVYSQERVPFTGVGNVTVTDYNVPLNVAVIYTLVKATGPDETAPSIRVTADASYLSVAAFPTQRTRILIEDDDQPSWENLGTTHKVIGRRAPLAVTGALHYRASTLLLYVADDAAYAELRSVVDTGEVLRLRPHQPSVAPATIFVQRIRSEWILGTGSPGARRVSLEYQAVAETPFVFTGNPLWTWSAVPPMVPSWSLMDDTFGTSWRAVAQYQPPSSPAPAPPPDAGVIGW